MDNKLVVPLIISPARSKYPDVGRTPPMFLTAAGRSAEDTKQPDAYINNIPAKNNTSTEYTGFLTTVNIQYINENTENTSINIPITDFIHSPNEYTNLLGFLPT